MEMRWLDPQQYAGYPLEFHYQTDRYYDVVCRENTFTLEEKRFAAPVEKCFTDTLFAPWLEDPVALGAFRGTVLTAVVEGSLESWHHVFRISNILVLEEFRQQGIGGQILEAMVRHAREIPGCRGVILETQSCNYPGICFYRKHGFTWNRIDLREYSNEDVAKREVRIDLFREFRKCEE